MSYQKGKCCVMQRGQVLCHIKRASVCHTKRGKCFVMQKGTSGMSYQKGKCCVMKKGQVACHIKRAGVLSCKKARVVPYNQVQVSAAVEG